jgi:transcriptional regulator with XRE-family HTH domain
MIFAPANPGLRLMLVRRMRGMSQAQLAAATGISAPNLSAVERGRMKLYPSYRARCAAALGIDGAELG